MLHVTVREIQHACRQQSMQELFLVLLKNFEKCPSLLQYSTTSFCLLLQLLQRLAFPLQQPSCRIRIHASAAYLGSVRWLFHVYRSSAVRRAKAPQSNENSSAKFDSSTLTFRVSFAWQEIWMTWSSKDCESAWGDRTGQISQTTPQVSRLLVLKIPWGTPFRNHRQRKIWHGPQRTGMMTLTECLPPIRIEKSPSYVTRVGADFLFRVIQSSPPDWSCGWPTENRTAYISERTPSNRSVIIERKQN